MCVDAKVIRSEDVSMYNRPPLLKEPFAQTLPGKMPKKMPHNSSSCRNGLLVLSAQLTLLTPAAVALAFDAIVHSFSGTDRQQQAQEKSAGHRCWWKTQADGLEKLPRLERKFCNERLFSGAEVQEFAEDLFNILKFLIVFVERLERYQNPWFQSGFCYREFPWISLSFGGSWAEALKLSQASTPQLSHPNSSTSEVWLGRAWAAPGMCKNSNPRRQKIQDSQVTYHFVPSFVVCFHFVIVIPSSY